MWDVVQCVQVGNTFAHPVEVFITCCCSEERMTAVSYNSANELITSHTLRNAGHNIACHYIFTAAFHQGIHIITCFQSVEYSCFFLSPEEIIRSGGSHWCSG